MNDALEQATLHDGKPQGREDITANHTHEKPGVTLKLVLLGAGSVVSLLVVVQLFLGWQFRHFVHTPVAPSEPPSPFALQPQAPPAPRLQLDPSGNYQQFYQSAQNALNTYGWQDRTAGIVRIPIEDAKRKLLQEGLPTRSQGGRR